MSDIICDGVFKDKRFQFDRKTNQFSKPSMETVHQAYSSNSKPTTFEKQDVKRTPVNSNDLILMNDWIQYRLLNNYLDLLIESIKEKLELSIDTREAFYFTAQRTTQALENVDEWIYLGAHLVEKMKNQPLNEQIEMIKDPNHVNNDEVKNEIIDSRMIETLHAKSLEFEEMYAKVVEKAILILDFIESYSYSADQLFVGEVDAQFNQILHALHISYLEIDAGDRLELDKCITIDICETEDISKEFLIKEVIKKGITVKGELKRKASVIVYRWEESIHE
ncbi:hypothetical protein [Exiguobacterium acetylicum]|uniref:hypothetical protein n=1 Tax=Exiguobacterium acetylicum TaxID=41170 RepID=UPI001CA757CD|nr:hypothetical protein [Exiguobacterium acetylicum]QZY86407.1 hypothetical protein K7G97_14245 [Exiguobacterium acetylicum]